ncbi:DsbA family oxidoreductase [Conexibacter woesei]|uniref:DSBA oxidoreductase n=1 Tax=Conexibacter woesei (strain DSM 14684 / CCUG 47730 / CIP 108061 / JCM 11494 / NBRC 100937 / ID131577) TaxID=469383 RepID=D3F6M5_CONWI|nr:DsbA family oxidoreductase [Conexibacter woesei]ADB50792.1 DSBA oxidoreductase [Conexibacter woesei DSM 14684]
MKIELYFDVLCPWCYIGKRKLTAALAGRDDVEVTWRSMELDPEGSATPGMTAAEVIAQYQSSPERAAARVHQIQALGAAEGLTLDLHRARPVNSFDAHRLVHLAASHGLADQAVEALLHGYHTRALDIADRGVLATLGAGVGLDAAEVRRTLDTDAFADSVRADERSALRRGIRGVPTLVVDDGPPVSAVQDPGALARLLSST